MHVISSMSAASPKIIGIIIEYCVIIKIGVYKQQFQALSYDLSCGDCR